MIQEFTKGKFSMVKEKERELLSKMEELAIQDSGRLTEDMDRVFM